MFHLVRLQPLKLILRSLGSQGTSPDEGNLPDPRPEGRDHAFSLLYIFVRSYYMEILWRSRTPVIRFSYSDCFIDLVLFLIPWLTRVSLTHPLNLFSLGDQCCFDCFSYLRGVNFS